MTNEQRISQHKAAKVLMAESRWTDAIELMQQTRAQHGDNLMLMIDLAASEYMAGSMFSWQETVREIETALIKNASILSPNTHYNALLFLGKFLEEQGQFKNALANYSMIVEGSAFDDRHKVMALSQLVRVFCFLGLSRQAEDAFVDLSTRLRAFKTENQKSEVLHALMLGDLAIVGAEAAVTRYVRARSEPRFLSDLPLLYFDLLDSLFANRLENAELLSQIIDPAMDQVNGFEKVLSQLAAGHDVSYSEAFARAEEMSLTTQLRLAVLIHARAVKPVDQARALNLLSVLLRSFDSFSAKALTTRFRLSIETDEAEVIVINSKSVEIRGQKINWIRRTTALSLLEALQDGTQLAIEDVVRRVWQSDYNASYDDRVRILVRRINVDLQSLVMRPEVIVYSGGRLALASGIQIRKTV